jgi:hypothetical protein
MKSKVLERVFGCVALLTLAAASVSAVAQHGKYKVFRGVMNAYTPQLTSNGKTTGPYEIRGQWSLKVNEWTGKADFLCFGRHEFHRRLGTDARIGEDLKCWPGPIRLRRPTC